jgi:hypothetical protein
MADPYKASETLKGSAGQLLGLVDLFKKSVRTARLVSAPDEIRRLAARVSPSADSNLGCP